MIGGKMELVVDGKSMTVEEGDSVYFDATKKHAMVAIDAEAKFLDLII